MEKEYLPVFWTGRTLKYKDVDGNCEYTIQQFDPGMIEKSFLESKEFLKKRLGIITIDERINRLKV